jgi:hypothetical protein
MVRRKSTTAPDRFTPEIDKQIIDGFVGDKEAMFEELALAGFSKDEIYKRSKSLGLSSNFVAQCRAGNTAVSVRRCLNCDETFVSMGVHLRLCLRCRRSVS